MGSFKFRQDERVMFDNGVQKGAGKIMGVATTELPVLGCSYIIEPDDPVSAGIEVACYPFKCFVVAECHLRSFG